MIRVDLHVHTPASYDYEDKSEPWLSVVEAAAEAMALGCRLRFESDYALSVTGIAGPTGGTPEKPVGLVFVSIATESDTWTREFHYSGSRSDIKIRAANTALNMVRLAILRRLAEGGETTAKD